MTGATRDSVKDLADQRSRAAYQSLTLYAAISGTDRMAQADAYERLWHYLFQVAHYVVSDQRDADALAQDCAQEAVSRIHTQLAHFRQPETFLAWARRIAVNQAIDELRRRRKLVPLAESDDDANSDAIVMSQYSSLGQANENDSTDDLINIVKRAPISARSRRVVVGRFWDGFGDEELARFESALVSRAVLPSQVQVPRSKDISKLRSYTPLLDYVKPKSSWRMRGARPPATLPST